MRLDQLLPWLTCVALLSVRLTVAIALSPQMAAYGIPSPVRVVLVVALATLTLSARPILASAVEWSADPLRLAPAIAAEVFVGATLGLAAHVMSAAFSLAGRLLDVQVGFSIGSIYDPVTRSSSNVLGSLVSLAGVTLFIMTDAQASLASLVALSLDLLPLGGLPLLTDPMRLLTGSSEIFAFGLLLVAPVSTALVLVDIAVGVASRTMPQMNVLTLAVPIKVLVGYLVLALSVSGWAILLPRVVQALTNDLRI